MLTSAQLGIPLNPPPNAVSPAVASIVAPSFIATQCSITLDASASTGSGGRTVEYTWTITLANSGSTTNIAALESAAATTTGPLLTLSVSDMPLAESLTVQVSYSTFIGDTGSTSTTIVRDSSSQVVPQVTVDTAGATSVTVLRSDNVPLKATVLDYGCDNPQLKPHTFAWTQSGGDPVPSELLSNTNADLDIPEGTLTVGQTYTFSVTAAANDNLSAVSDPASVTITVGSSPVTAVITGGSVRTLPRSRNITLDASESLDPDADASAFTYLWSCFTSTTTAATATAGTAFNKGTPCAGFVSSGAAAQEIVGVDFTEGNYVLEVVASKGARSAAAEVLLLVVAGQPPLSAILTPFAGDDGSNGIINAGTTVEFIGEAVSSTNAAVTFTWKLNGVTLDSASVASAITFRDQVNSDSSSRSSLNANGVVSQRVIVIDAEALKTLTPSDSAIAATDATVTHKLTLEAADENGVAVNEVLLTVNNSPTGGTFVVNPLTGEELVTDFTLTMAGWTDTDSPLSYYFTRETTDSNGSPTEIALTLPNLSNKATLKLPRGTGASNTLVLKGYAVDSRGATASRSITVTVNPRTITPQEQSAALKNLAQAVVDDSNQSDADRIREATTIAEALNEVEKEGGGDNVVLTDSAETRKKLIEVLDSETKADQKKTPLKVSQIADAAQKITTTTVELPQDDREKASAVLKDIANSSTTQGFVLDADVSIVQGVDNISKSQNPSTLENVSTDSLETLRAVSAGQLVREGCSGAPRDVRSTRIRMSSLRGDISGKQVLGPQPEAASGDARIGVTYPANFLADRGTCFDTQVIDLTYNPYAWSPLTSVIEPDTQSVNVRAVGKTEEEVVQNLTEPVKIVLRHDQDPANITPDNGGNELCRFWDVNKKIWSSEGCVLGVVTKDTAECLCDHLTEFALGINTVDLGSSASSLARVEDNPGPIVLVCLNLVLFAVTLVYAFWREKQVAVKAAFKEDYAAAAQKNSAYSPRSMSSAMSDDSDIRSARSSVYSAVSPRPNNSDDDISLPEVQFDLPEQEAVATTDMPGHSFKKSLWQTIKFKFKNNHSIGRVLLYTKPDPRFPLHQRVICFYTIVSGSMLSNSLFYGLGRDTTLAWFVYGFFSALVCFPFSMMLSQLFMRSRPDDEPPAVVPSNAPTAQKIAAFTFPHWMNYVAYTISFVLVFFASFYTLVFGLSWFDGEDNEEQATTQWIVSVIISVVFQLVAQEPLKILTLGTVLTAVTVTKAKREASRSASNVNNMAGQHPSRTGSIVDGLRRLSSIFTSKRGDNDEDDDEPMSPVMSPKSDASHFSDGGWRSPSVMSSDRSSVYSPAPQREPKDDRDVFTLE
eukprot:GFYU01005788.1.p1 GENE.GFYU01005788.1~~GFYU01005788.1.p1  ORF type:complete len:1359 (-),score=515.36 GFYU01005788.1:102-4136(-)